MKQRLAAALPPLTAFALVLALLLDPAAAATGVREGLSLALSTAVPALFPFFLASSLLVRTGGAGALGRLLTPLARILFGLPGAAASALALGLAGGYPIGARTVRELYDSALLTREQAERALACCNNTGPGFLVGLCGVTLLGSREAGLFLYAIHALAALLTGFALSRSDDSPSFTPVQTATSPPFAVCFVDCVQSAGVTALRVTAFITAFSALLQLLRSNNALDLLTNLVAPLCPLLGLPQKGAQALILGSFELTCGLTALPAASSRQLLPAMSFLTAFGGLSVWCQSAAVLAGSGLRLRPCILGKCLHGLLASTLTTLLLRLFPRPLPTFAWGTIPQESSVLPGIFLLLASILLPFVSGKMARHPL